jgi:hypothetical protein
MFDKSYEQQLTIWREFRHGLESAQDPIQEAIDFYNQAPYCLLLEENNYCAFVKILAICYTLQLTDVLKRSKYEIHITRDYKNSATYYLLYVDDNVIGFDAGTYVHRTEIPNTLRSELVHQLPNQ